MSDQQSQVNGRQNLGANGTTTASVDIKTEGRGMDGKNASMFEQLPPELAHITANFQPLSRLLERSAQECYNNLDETITALAGIPLHIDEKVLAHPENFKNIVVSGEDAHKRLRWLEFGKAQRERFVKLLVLTRWSRQVDDVGKVIDLFNWMNIQSNIFGEVDESMAQLRRWLDGEKVPAPDLESALEVLATGTSSKMPDLGFVKPEPLNAAEILDTFRNINTVLHLRLNTVEELPHHLRNFKIASGRVTFTIPNEFELDLSIADEDPASQFYFIDFRFLFSPRSEIPAGSVHDFEASANNALASEGLTGCYNLFHDFVLTHKINILRRQAINLNRTSWAGSLDIEQVHRSLIIQYWTSKPGPKSWIEIGIASNRSTQSSSSTYIPQRQSGLKIKWMRSAEEVKDFAMDLDDVDLDCSHLLENVLAEHSDYLLSAISHSIPQTNLIYESLTDASFQPKIVAPLFQEQTMTLSIQPTTGNFHMSPVTHESLHCQDQLNMLPSPVRDGSGVLRGQLPFIRLNTMARSALSFNWKMVMSPQHGHFPRSQKVWLADVHSCAFRPGSWAFYLWSIGVTVDSSGAIEWSVFQEASFPGTLHSISQLVPWYELVLPSQSGTSRDSDLEANPVSSLITPSSPHTAPFKALGHAAWFLIFLETVQGYLREHKVPFQFSAVTSAHHDLDSSSNLSSITIETASFLKDSNAAQRLNGNSLILSLLGSSGTDSRPLMLKGMLKDLTPHFTELSKFNLFTDIGWHSDSTFTLRAPEAGISSGPCIPTALAVLRTRLLWLCRIPEYMSILKRRGFKCTSISMESISFQYPYRVGDQKLHATCTVNHQSEIVLSHSKHSLIVQQLRTMLQASACGLAFAQGGHDLQIGIFDKITRALLYTLPLAVVTRLDKLESKSSTEEISLHISTQAWDTILLHYHDKYSREYSFRISLVRNYNASTTSAPACFTLCRIEHVDFAGSSGGSMTDLGLRNDVSQYLAGVLEQETPKVSKLDHGIVCDMEDVEAILDDLDEAVKKAMLKEPVVVDNQEEGPSQVQNNSSEPPRKRQRSEARILQPQAQSMARQSSTSNTLHPQAQPMARGLSDQNQNQALAHAQLMARGISNQGQAQPMMVHPPVQGQPPQSLRGPTNPAQALALAQMQSQAQFQAQLKAQFQAQAQQAQVRQAQLQAQAQAQARKMQPQKQPPLRPPQGQQVHAQQAQAAAWQNMQGVNGAQNMTNNGPNPGSSNQRPNAGQVEVVELD